MGDPFGKSLDKDGADAEFPGEVVDGAVALAQFPLDLLHDIAEVLVVGERDVQDIGEVREVALEVRAEFIVGRPELFFRLGAGLWHPPLLLDKISLLQDLEAQGYAVIIDLGPDLVFGQPRFVQEFVDLLERGVVERHQERN